MSSKTCFWSVFFISAGIAEILAGAEVLLKNKLVKCSCYFNFLKLKKVLIMDELKRE
jgi:hypothetical protein